MQNFKAPFWRKELLNNHEGRILVLVIPTFRDQKVILSPKLRSVPMCACIPSHFLVSTRFISLSLSLSLSASELCASCLAFIFGTAGDSEAIQDAPVSTVVSFFFRGFAAAAAADRFFLHFFSSFTSVLSSTK